MTVHISGVEAALTGVDPARITTALQAATFGVATEVSNRIRPYPEQRALQHPSRRTGQLGQGWRVEHQGATDARVTNRVRYAPYVQGAGTQTAYHKAAGWLTDEGVAQAVETDGTVQRIATQAIEHVFGGR